MSLAAARPPSAAALRALRATPPASDPHRLAELCAAGHLRLGPGPADGPLTALHAPAGAPYGLLRVRADRWPSTDDLPLLLDGLARHLADPCARDPVPPQPPAPLPDGRPALERAIAAWSPPADPLRLRLGALLAALDALPDAPIEDPRALMAAWRLALEHRRLALPAAWAQLGPRLDPRRAAHWAREGGVLRLGPAILACPPRPGPRGALEPLLAGLGPGQVLGIAGPAAAGKTTLARALAQRLDALHVQADQLTHAGPGFRYRQHPGHREDWVEGPGIYDEPALRARLRAAREQQRPVVADGVYLGLDPRTRSLLDALVVLAPDPALAWARKARRDAHPTTGRRIDLPTDFARKLFREHTDALPRLAAQADAVLTAAPRP